jgi:Bacterial inner membrane protein
MSDLIGWTATLAFAVSYFFRKQVALRRVQAVAALLWIGYGVTIRSSPVIVANVVVALIAIVSSFQRPRESEGEYRV